MKINGIIKPLIVPLTVLAVFISLQLLWRLLNLPSQDQLLVIVRHYFDRYGLAVVFVSALIEGFFVLGEYYPGGFVIFLGVISAGKDVPRVISVVATVSIAFFIAYYFDYLMGKYGWYRLFAKFGLMGSIDTAKERVSGQAFNAIILSYWNPDLASVTATAAGILRFPIRRFFIYSFVSILVWNCFWGILIYLLGEEALKLTNVQYIIIALALWVLFIFLKELRAKKKALASSKS